MSTQTPTDPNQIQAVVATTLREHSTFFLVEGIILLILGALAIMLPPLATLTVTIIFGWIFLVSGLIGWVPTLGARSGPQPVYPPDRRRSLAHTAADRLFRHRGHRLDHVRGRASPPVVGPVGMDGGERHHRPPARRHHLRGPAGHRRLGARPPRRHQPDLRRRRADRHGAARAAGRISA